ncbi:Rhodanese-like protein [Trametopsis cervina]|nr:Rhodanese-like protein [Trametopsis cervina]
MTIVPRSVVHLPTRQLSTSLARFNESSGVKPAASLEKPAEQMKDWSARVLTYEELKPRTEQPSPDAYLIDVREPDEVVQGSIPSSVNLPLSVLANSITLSAETFKQKFGWEKPRRDQEIVFYCRSGKRSSSACDIATRNGFTNILNYTGSWLDWTARENERKSA